MLFLEGWFWVFTAVAVPGYWLCPSRFKLYWLLVASATFQYHFAGPAGMAPIILLAVATYFGALLPRPWRGFPLVATTSAALVGALVFYKYSTFLLQSASSFVAATGFQPSSAWAAWRSPAVPLGISFFIFEFLHYLYEVRVGGRPAIRNPFHFSVFAIFFPTLAAGPIKRFPDFVPQLRTLRNPTPEIAWDGARRIIRGLFKKVCIADLLVEYIVVFESVTPPTRSVVVALAVLQGFRIYYDFAGYSDIAIGLARMLNLRVPENFYRPYFSTSLREFWRRWHMSLSSWIRDYVYIPLGGNRAHRAFNLLAAMVICGLWHGAAWNFALWGLYHGGGLVVESAVRHRYPAFFGGELLRRILGWTVCYTYVTYGWLLFFYPADSVYRMTLVLLPWQ